VDSRGEKQLEDERGDAQNAEKVAEEGGALVECGCRLFDRPVELQVDDLTHHQRQHHDHGDARQQARLLEHLKATAGLAPGRAFAPRRRRRGMIMGRNDGP